MNLNREAVYGAVFAKLSGIAGVTTASRRLRHIEEMQQEEFPAVFQVQQDESWDGKVNLPTKKTFNVEWWVYVGEPDLALAPSTKLNAFLDTIDELFGSGGSSGLSVDTLGGLVFNATINGKIEIIEGVLGDRALAIIPIRVVKAD